MNTCIYLNVQLNYLLHTEIKQGYGEGAVSENEEGMELFRDTAAWLVDYEDDNAYRATLFVHLWQAKLTKTIRHFYPLNVK